MRRRLAAAGATAFIALIGCDGSAPATTRAAFGLDARPPNPTCVAPARPPPTVSVAFERVYANVALANSVVLAQIPGDRSRWFVAERMGPDGGDARIVSFAADHPADTPALVATLGPVAYVREADGEGGLLGMAFHPRFADNGRLFVSWVEADAASPSGARSTVGYLTSRDGGAHFGGYRELFGFAQSTSHYHKGGGLAFGPDGMLYASFGDGGTGDDMLRHGQSRDGFFAKIQRIDVDQAAGRPEMFAWGLRNPFRFSFDRATGQLWAGDVGQNWYEEIDLVTAGGNYGWPCREGAHDHILPPDPRCPSVAGLVDPVVEQSHAVPGGNARAIIGGVVYRGKALPALAGTYLFADFARRELWAVALDASSSTAAAAPTLLNDGGTPEAGWVDFAEDADGEVYVLGLEGVIYKLVAAAPAADAFPARLSQTGCVDPADARAPAAGLIPYDVNAPLWSDGADKTRFVALPDGATADVDDEGRLVLPIGSVVMKSFRLGGKLVETRLLMRHDDGGWAGYSYAWLDDQSDAILLPSSAEKRIGESRWSFPSRGQCLLCHNPAAGGTLGLEVGQLDGDFAYPSTGRVANQLATLDHIGLFSTPLGPTATPAYADPLGDAPLEARARAYLHANCAICHRPDGPGIVDMDLRMSRSFAETRTCDVAPTGEELGVTGALRIAPGDPERSLVSVRARSPALGRMPPLASHVVDEAGLAVVDAWIAGLDGCPPLTAPRTR